MLIYSRPKGDYKGETANHVLVDFYVANVTLAEGKEHVHVTVTGPGIDKPLDGHVEKFGNAALPRQPPERLLPAQGRADGRREQADRRAVELDHAHDQVDHDAPADPAAAHGDHGDAGAPGKDAGAPKDGGAPKPGTKPAGSGSAKPGPMPTQTTPLPGMGGKP